jgi:hypothetical protein
MSDSPEEKVEYENPQDDPTWHEVFERPNELKDRVGTGPVLDAVTLARIDSVMQDFQESYANQVEDDVADLEDYFKMMRSGGKFDAKRFWSMVHDIRSEAGTFGYPLISDIGTSLCEFLAGAETFADRDLQAVELHVTAMRTVVTRNISGDGGEVGKQVTDALHQMVSRLVAAYEADAKKAAAEADS